MPCCRKLNVGDVALKPAALMRRHWLETKRSPTVAPQAVTRGRPGCQCSSIVPSHPSIGHAANLAPSKSRASAKSTVLAVPSASWPARSTLYLALRGGCTRSSSRDAQDANFVCRPARRTVSRWSKPSTRPLGPQTRQTMPDHVTKRAHSDLTRPRRAVSKRPRIADEHWSHKLLSVPLSDVS